jgi:thioredoxin reductase (NADPH)
MDSRHDLLIIGGGPAGLTAGIYAARETLDVILVEKGITGGIPAIVDHIENFPGFPEGISGMELMQRMRAQADRFNLKVDELVEVESIMPEKGGFRIVTDNNEYQSRAVIIASGGHPRQLGVPGEKEMAGKGVSYCATCDGPFFKDADLVVVGGGNAAVQEALYLTKFARQVTIVHRRDQLRAQPILQEHAFKNPKIKIIWDSVVAQINGDEQLTGVTLRNVKTGDLREISAQGVFIFIGWIPNTDFVKDLLQLDEEGHIITDSNMQTSVAGIFAVGDVRSKPFRQIANAIGDGAIGALAASKYLEGY